MRETVYSIVAAVADAVAAVAAAAFGFSFPCFWDMSQEMCFSRVSISPVSSFRKLLCFPVRTLSRFNGHFGLPFGPEVLQNTIQNATLLQPSFFDDF